MSRVTHVGVVVPARDEEELLPGCLEALRVAVEAARTAREVQAQVVVVLDTCADRSADVLRAHPWVESLEVELANVGAARRAGAEAVLRAHASVPPDRLWLASTDADSQVPVDWLVRMVDLVATGADVVVGTVNVDDWESHDPRVADRWHEGYARHDPHPHVHGANLGLTAEAYVAAGGFPAVALGEDVALVEAMAGRRVVRTSALTVRTSARARNRVDGGFAGVLLALAEDEAV